MATTSSSPLGRLRSLQDKPQEQVAFALTLLDGRQERNVLLSALEVLAEYPEPTARSQILQLYAQFAAKKGIRDQGGYVRRALLDALRPIASIEDIELLCVATETYEYWPPDFGEDAVLVRAAGLIALNQVDDELARFYAARLLVDPHVAPMSGEPAVTAARVLGARGDLVPLWTYIFLPDDAPVRVPEVVGECVVQMTRLPVPLVSRLVDRVGDSQSTAARLGLYQVLIDHEEGPQSRSYLRRELLENRDLDMFRFLVMTMVASGDEGLLNDLAAVSEELDDPRCLAVLIQGFDLLPGPRHAQLGNKLRQRIGQHSQNKVQ